MEKICCTAKVVSTNRISHNADTQVFSLKLEIDKRPRIFPGQFFMLKAEPSGTLLGRPISLYRICAETETDAAEISHNATLEFLILQKGRGTAELCSLAPQSCVQLLGPLGNTFPLPARDQTEKLLLVGGGIGTAPVAGFAALLQEKTYDFCACFKSSAYALDYIKPAELVIASEDGSAGTRGILPDVLTAENLLQKKYAAVYACGPAAMLAYVQTICKESGTPCFISMENRMACGVGVCLGCTILTTEGNKRCCVDGPVFEAEKLIFTPQNVSPRAKISPNEISAAPDLSVNIAGLALQNPVIAASGTFGYGKEYASLIDITRVGAICTKGLTLEARAGNSGVRLHETPSGLMNSIGLENPGIAHFIARELPELRALLTKNPRSECGTKIIANLSGSSIETYIQGARLLDASDIDAVELNISCPNVKAGGMAFGLNPKDAADVTAAVRGATKKPLIVKISPNAPDIVSVALAVREAGADALSMVNTFQALAIDIETARPVFNNITAGLSGPAIKPLALKALYDVSRVMRNLPCKQQIPVIALGGIGTWQDAVEFIMAGAGAVQVGTANFFNPRAMLCIIDGLAAFMQKKGFDSIADFCGAAL